MDRRRLALAQSVRLLEGCSPLKVLSRGYAVVQNMQGSALSSVEEVAAGQPVQVRMRDGVLHARVESAEKPNEAAESSGQLPGKE